MKLLRHMTLLLSTALITMNSGAALMNYNSQEVRFGRFSVDLPRMSSIAIDAKYLGVDVTFHDGALSKEKFKDEQDALAHGYEQRKMQVDQDTLDLYQGSGIDPAKEYGSNRLIQYLFDSTKSESFLAYRKDADSPAMIARVSRLGPTGVSSFEITNRTASGVTGAYNDILRAEKVFQFSSVDTTIPVHAFFLKNGFFDDGGRSTGNEHAGLTATLGGRQDAELSVETTSRTSQSQGFNDIEKDADGQIQLLKDAGGQVTVLRRGKRALVGQTGYEIAVKVDAPGHQTIYIFTWASAGTTGDPLKPVVQFDLRIDPNVHHGVSTISSPAEAEQLWEKLVASFKVR